MSLTEGGGARRDLRFLFNDPEDTSCYYLRPPDPETFRRSPLALKVFFKDENIQKLS